jgi:hypothetical protein
MTIQRLSHRRMIFSKRINQIGIWGLSNSIKTTPLLTVSCPLSRSFWEVRLLFSPWFAVPCERTAKNNSWSCFHLKKRILWMKWDERYRHCRRRCVRKALSGSIDPIQSRSTLDEHKSLIRDYICSNRNTSRQSAAERQSMIENLSLPTENGSCPSSQLEPMKASLAMVHHINIIAESAACRRNTFRDRSERNRLVSCSLSMERNYRPDHSSERRNDGNYDIYR